ncbi:MAG: hypothetical protein KF743_09110 [Fimbriimonadaceae bacterium]|nr:hypothetical protein [Fimbriimonadaceae bacterium]
MKTWQVIAAASAVYLGGCAGFAAYVPDGNTNTGGTPLQCAAITLSTNTNPQAPQGSDTEEVLQITNGQVNTLHGRSPGDAVVTLSITGLPNGLGFTFADGETQPTRTVPLNSTWNEDIHYLPDGTIQPGDYQVTIRAQEQGCPAVTQNVTVSVIGGG